MVEFAVCMPLLSILALGSVEVSNAIFLKQALVASAYAGACQSVKANSTTASTLSTAKSALEFRSIKNASITYQPELLRLLVVVSRSRLRYQPRSLPIRLLLDM